MIIISQDKTMILNFEYIETIEIENPLENNDGKFKILCDTTSDNQYTIAEYKTEERAKEVLAEIVQKYSSYLQLNGGPAILQGQMDIQPNIFNIPKVYEMPEK